MAQRSNRRSGSLVKNVVLDTAIFMRPGARATHLGQGSRPETGYVDADQHAIQFYPCRRGGPYVFALATIDPVAYVGHSLRSGFLTSAAESGASIAASLARDAARLRAQRGAPRQHSGRLREPILAIDRGKVWPTLSFLICALSGRAWR